MRSRQAAPFPFLELPLELRTMVYNNLLEDPYYPPPAPCSHQHESPFSWLMPGLFPPSQEPRPQLTHQPKHHRTTKPSNWLFLANKQTYNEYMELMCKKTTFHLTVSPQNYTAPTPEGSDTQAPEEEPKTTQAPAESKRIWNISPETLKHLRKCDIKLVATSPMLGVTDPRNMKPGDWALAQQIRRELKEVANVRELNLQVKAIGDPLWNPLWVWYHASQSLKTMGAADNTTGTAPTGPKLNRITFSLDTWSPGENLLERDPASADQWTWKCLHGHCVALDGPGEVSVREFCARLYMECTTCRPELEDEENE